MSQSKRLFILEKAIELFSIHGFEAVSIQDITNYCGISKGAFYLSFKSKDELMIAIVEHLLTSVALIFDRAVNSVLEPQLRLQRLFEDLLAFMRMNRGIATFFIHEHIHFQNKNKPLIQLFAKYEDETRSTLGDILEGIYGEKIKSHKQDLILCLNSLFHTYFEYVCLRGLDVEVSILAQSLVEKINILANADYKYALPDEYILELSCSNRLSKEDLTVFKSRIIQDIDYRLIDERQPILYEALKQIKHQLEVEIPETPLLYAYSALLKEYDQYMDLALRLRSYIKIMFPQTHDK